jgi:AraC-like DNA-binding protein
VVALHRITPHPVALPGITAVTAQSARRFARHSHDQFGIGLVLDGAQTSASGRGQVWGQAGDIITVNPGEVHDGIPVDDRGRHWRMLYLDPAVMARLTDHPGEFSHPVLRNPALGRALHRLFAALTTTGLSLGAEADLVILRAALDDRPKPALPAPVARTVEALRDDPARAVTLAELAASAGLSRFHFLRSFARATGLTPHAFQLQSRLHLARRLIAQGTALAEAAQTAGFADQSHLSRLFQRSYGMPPGAYARNFVQDRGQARRR